MRFCSESGQSTVEAAVLLPVIFAIFGLLLQPAILLYNRCIMNAAASEGCRLVATNTADDATIRTYTERRLEPIPKIDIFHAKQDWIVTWSQSQDGFASITIENHVQPLPLFGITANLMDAMGEDGMIVQRVAVSCTPIPSWAGAQGYSPSTWIGKWK